MGVIIEFSSQPKISRRTAIHEAGHAVVAWFTGRSNIEIAAADEARKAKTSTGLVADCVAVTQWQKVTPRTLDDLQNLSLRERTDPDRVRGIKVQAAIDMIIAMAGIVAESIYSGVEIGELMNTSGKSDMESISDLKKVLLAVGVTQEEAEGIQEKSLTRCYSFVQMKWWEVIALAKIIENKSHIPPSYFIAIMGMIDHPFPTVISLQDMDNIASQ